MCCVLCIPICFALYYYSCATQLESLAQLAHKVRVAVFSHTDWPLHIVRRDLGVFDATNSGVVQRVGRGTGLS